MIVKINRFGHAMDPDRGILFFVSMLFGLEHITTKFIIKREKQSGKESYDALFDGFSESLKDKLEILINKIEKNPNSNNVLKLFQTAIGASALEFDKLDSRSYKIPNNSLRKFLETYPSITYKSIFLNSTKLQLCDYKQNILCEVTWDYEAIKQYLKKLKTTINKPLDLSYLFFNNAKEDIITYASVNIFQKLGCNILSVSYPGAQGDRAILIGQGRKTKRIYLDIIAYKDSQKFFVFLHENKEKFNDLKKDEEKLLKLKDCNIDSIRTLFTKLHCNNNFYQNNIYLGLGSKVNKGNRLFSQYFNVDYIFSFDIQSFKDSTNILYNIAVINFDLCEFFKPILNKENKLQGLISIEKIYKT